MTAGAEDEAWEAAQEVLDSERFDEVALNILARAERLLAANSDDETRSRRASVQEGLLRCHKRAGRVENVATLAIDLLDGEWPEDALPARLNAAFEAINCASLTLDKGRQIAGRAIEVAETSGDPDHRAFVAELLKWLADAVSQDSPEQRQALLQRVQDEYADVDDESDSAADRLNDPYHRGLALVDEAGRLKEAEAAFRQALAEGQDGAWLELAFVLARQADREDEEEHALRAAIDADDGERRAFASHRLGCFLLHVRNDRQGARDAFGQATTGTGPHATAALQELAVLAARDGDHEARRALIAELAGREFAEWDPDARDKNHSKLAAASRIGYAKPLIAIRAMRWRRARRQAQRRTT